jgi:hypothetical protein
MRVAQILPILLMLGTSSTTPQWIDRQGRPLPQTPSMKSHGNLGVQLVLTPDEKSFRHTWNTATAAPQLRSTDSLRRGEQISAMILFHGCTAGRSGKCDGDVKFTLIDPSGKNVPAGEGPLWSLPPQIGRLLLSDTSLTVGFDANDKPGTYKVQATVTDKVSGKKLDLVAPFKLSN